MKKLAVLALSLLSMNAFAQISFVESTSCTSNDSRGWCIMNLSGKEIHGAKIDAEIYRHNSHGKIKQTKFCVFYPNHFIDIRIPQRDMDKSKIIGMVVNLLNPEGYPINNCGKRVDNLLKTGKKVVFLKYNTTSKNFYCE